MTRLSPVFCFFIFLLISCGVKEKENNGNNQDLILELPLPDVPESLDSDKIAGYLLTHFWDSLDFTDTLRTYNRDFMEQNFANFAHLLIVSNDSIARKEGAKVLMKKALVDPKAYKIVSEIAYHYLYDPNSPMLHEESFIPFLEIFSESEILDEDERDKNRYLLEGALKNRPGMRAADFPYVTREGKVSSLYKTSVKGNLLVIFYEPDCENCKKIIKEISDNQILSEMINQGALTLLAIYSGDNKKLWDETAPQLPKEWIVGYNADTIEDNDDYILLASPTIYLLDEKKTVIVKDLPPSQLY